MTRPDSSWRRRLLAGGMALGAGLARAQGARFAGPAAEVLRRAQASRWYAQAERLRPEFAATADGAGFVAVWRPPGAAPRHWIASLHGSRGFATDDLALWHGALGNRPVGLLCLQWWVGNDDSPRAYLPPLAIYRELDLNLARVGAQPGQVMLHGFSRGSANAYAVAALDAGRGRRYFAWSVASSGAVAEDYPPTRAILEGRYGPQPLRGTRWITVAGARDPDPERDGIPAMRRTAEWLRGQGAARVESIEDPSGGHGALMTNPANAARVLDLAFGPV